MKSLRELLDEMALTSKANPDRAIAFTKEGELKSYSKEEAAAMRNNWLADNLEGEK